MPVIEVDSKTAVCDGGEYALRCHASVLPSQQHAADECMHPPLELTRACHR